MEPLRVEVWEVLLDTETAARYWRRRAALKLFTPRALSWLLLLAASSAVVTMMTIPLRS